MGHIPTIELSFETPITTVEGLELAPYACPSIRFLDKRGLVVGYIRELAASDSSETEASDNRFATRGPICWFWGVRENLAKRKYKRILEKIRSHVLDLLLREHQTINLECAWPSSSHLFQLVDSPGTAGEIADELRKVRHFWLHEVQPD